MLSINQQSFARTGEFSPQEIFLFPLIIFGALMLLKFSALIEHYTKHLNIFLRIVIKGICFILFIGVIGVIVAGIGFIFEYIPKKWSMIF